MARSTPVRKAWRSLAWLAVIIVTLVGVNLFGVLTAGATWTPKLGLDLEGGTQITLAPLLESGQTVSQEQLDQAVAIIRQRVDSSGVSEAEISTQGSQNIVVSIPGTPDDQTLERIQSSAKLEFRAVICATDVNPAYISEACTPTTPTAAPTPEPTETATVSGTEDEADSEASTDVDTDGLTGSDEAWITPAILERYSTLDCSALNEGANVAPSGEPLVACQDDGTAKYILGPVEVDGATISDATSGTVPNSQGASTGVWSVNIEFNEEGTEDFADVTRRLITFPDTPDGNAAVQNRFAIVLDGKVITAPGTNDPITNGKAQITGTFDQVSAETLANQLKFGALPIGFRVDTSASISATLGTSQLVSGLIAGLIGLILVVLYSLVQYRALAAVTIASLVIAGVIAYLIVTFMSWRQGYRLSLAGVAGLIVAIGITADSFIVYFERIRDELRDGRSLEGAVESGWRRAVRTIIASDTVNFLAAAVLFLLAIGNVKGFALTLGLTTLIDLVVVALFTHPMLQLLARTRFFGNGHPLSGLDPQALGAVYRGRARFMPRSAASSTGKAAASEKEAARRQTIAERKALESVGTSRTKGKDS